MRHEFFVAGTKAYKPLSQKEELWVAEYLSCLNAVKAGLRIGLTREQAKNCSTWLSPTGPKPHVFRAVRNGITARMNRLSITGDAVLAELGRLGFSNMLNYVKLDADDQPMIDLTDLTPDTAAAIKKITVEEYKEGRGENAREIRKVTLELHDKKAPLIALGKHLGLFGEGGGSDNRSSRDDDALAPDGQVGAQQTINNFNIQLIPAGQHFQGDNLVPVHTIDGTLAPDKQEIDTDG